MLAVDVSVTPTEVVQWVIGIVTVAGAASLAVRRGFNKLNSRLDLTKIDEARWKAEFKKQNTREHQATSGKLEQLNTKLDNHIEQLHVPLNEKLGEIVGWIEAQRDKA